MKYQITVPLSLIDTIFCEFQGEQFTTFAVLTHAKVNEVEDWKDAIRKLISDNALELVDTRTLGEVYRLNCESRFVRRYLGGAA